MANNYVDFSFTIIFPTPEAAAAALADANNEKFRNGESEEFDPGRITAGENNQLWCYSDDSSSSPEDAANLVRRLLKKHHPEGVVCFEWAEHCDKPRIAEFGGGACVVTANHVEISTTQALRDFLLWKVQSGLKPA